MKTLALIVFLCGIIYTVQATASTEVSFVYYFISGKGNHINSHSLTDQTERIS